MIAKKRLSLTLAAGVSIELLNKLAPLIILHWAQTRLGLAAFGYAQFGLATMEMAIPFIAFGYNNYGSIQVGQHRDDPPRISGLMSNIIALKIMHALVIFAMLVYMATYVQSYTTYLPLILALSFVLLFAATETLWVQVGIQKMAVASLFTGFARFSSLGLILLLVANPRDAILYAALTLASNAMICLLTTIYCFRKFSFVRPRFSEMKAIFKGSIMFATISVLVTFMDRFDIILSEKYFGLDGAGLYAGAARLNHSFMQIVNVVIVAFFSEMVAIKEKDAFDKHLSLGVWLLMFAIIPTIIGTWYIGPDLLELILGGRDFRRMGFTLNLLLLSSLSETFMLVFGFQILLLKNRSKAMVTGMVLGAICALASAIALSSIPSLGLDGIAMGALLGKSLAAILIVSFSLPFISRFPLSEIGNSLLAGCVMLAVLIGLPREHLWFNLFGAAFIYLLVQGFLNLQKIKTLIAYAKARKAT